MNWSDFFHMGGYGFYVWGSYLAAFILLAGEVWLVLRKQKTLRKNTTRNLSE